MQGINGAIYSNWNVAGENAVTRWGEKFTFMPKMISKQNYFFVEMHFNIFLHFDETKWSKMTLKKL